MLYTPLPTQRTGAVFLADRRRALLADAPRVGKTGAAIIASDYVLAGKILTITTASGRAVWRRGYDAWSMLDRRPQIITPAKCELQSDCVIVGWPDVANPKVRSALMRVPWDVVKLDESHYAKNHEAKRTQAVYGDFQKDGHFLDTSTAITGNANAVWCLSGTPLPHSPADAYPMLRALAPERLAADPAREWPDVTKHGDFLHRYCIVKMKKISNFNRIPVVIGGRNLAELQARMNGFFLRRTQEDVGIRPPSYEIMPLIVSDRMKRSVEGSLDAGRIIAAAEAGDTRELDMHLGPLRRLTGEIKAHALVDAVSEEIKLGLDKIVVMYWHRDVGHILKDGLSSYGVVGIDGATSANNRSSAEQRFLHDPSIRVFLGQIQAAGEAIDLSSAAELIFAETSLVPKDMAQASLRVTNHSQARLPRVRVVTMEGSIDEAIQSRLMMLWTNIREVLGK